MGDATSWVFSHSVIHTLLAWQRALVGKKRKKNLDGCSFDNEVFNTQKIKSNFLSNLWKWANLYNVVSTNSFVDFLVWLGCR